MMRTAKQITTHSRLPLSLEEFVRDFVVPSRPLLVRKAVSEWCSHWTVKGLWQRLDKNNTSQHAEARFLIASPGANYVARCQPQNTTIERLRQIELQHQFTNHNATTKNRPMKEKDYTSHEVELTTRQALERFQTLSNTNTLCQCRLDVAAFWNAQIDKLPPFMQENAFDIVYDNSWVWITSPKLRTSLHPDFDHNILAHLAGRKRAILINPYNKSKQDLDKLYTYRWISGTVEMLYLQQQEKKSSDLMYDIDPEDLYLVELHPGDMLFMPKGWLHDIESMDETVSLVTRFQIKGIDG